jgi:hypothetical protein
MPFTLLQNLKLTIPTALGFALAGYVVSLPLSFVVDRDAASFKFNLSKPPVSMERERLTDLGKFQAGVALGGAVLGVVVVQVTFVARALVTKRSLD